MSDTSKEKLSAAEEIECQELVRAFRDVFALASGKRVLFWMLEQCAIYQDAYAGENNATNYTLGRQSVGRRLIEMLDHIDPRLYPSLLLDVAELKAMDRAAAQRASHQEEEEDEE